jgi:catechol 1,2-dioxygenase
LELPYLALEFRNDCITGIRFGFVPPLFFSLTLNKSMDRRNFLKASSLTAIALSTFGSVVNAGNGTFEGDCETTDDILGPFYRPNAPERENMTSKTLEGSRIRVKGKVFGDDCKTVLKDAVVEIWHCNTLGEYDNKSPEFNQRAKWTTRADGAYSFLTIVPGKYLNGELYRPSHIHFRVSAKGYKELVSQIYFKGDPEITADPWASQQKAKSRILDIFPATVESELGVLFDIYLVKK